MTAERVMSSASMALMTRLQNMTMTEDYTNGSSQDYSHNLKPNHNLSNDDVVSSGDLSLTDDGDPRIFPRAATIMAAVFAIIFIIVGVVGNLITILALCNSRKLRMHATTYFVLSLCISDLIFCVINLPLTASRYIHEAWIHGLFLCRLFPFFFYGNMACSLLSMVAITINRYVLIAHYTWYDRIYRTKYITGMIAFVWIFSFAMMMPPLLEIWGRLGLEDHPGFSCTILKDSKGRSPKKFLFIFGILIPCIVIIFCYSCIYFRVRKSRRNLMAHRADMGDGSRKATHMSVTQKNRLRRDDIQLTKMMSIIFACFILCFLPLMALNVFDHDMSRVPPWIHICGSILAWSSSCVNLFIYVVTNRQYRQAYEELLCWRKLVDAKQSHTASRSSKTFFTEMIHLNVASDKVKINLKPNNGITPTNHDDL